MAALVEVLGPGCRRCSQAVELVSAVVAAERLEVEVRHVTDPAEIVGRGFFMRTPAVVVDGSVVATGRVPGRAELVAWLRPNASAPRSDRAGAPPPVTAQGVRS
jgi:hypothetical protein